MAFTLLSSTQAGSTNAGLSVTTPTIDTTGANLLVAVMAYYQFQPAFSDSKGNTWTAANTQTNATFFETLYYCYNPVTSATHSASSSAVAGSFPAIVFAAFSGSFVSPLEQVAGGASNVAGPITPLYSSELVISSLVSASMSPPSLSGLTLVGGVQDNSGQNVAVGLAYAIQTASAATTATWNSASSSASSIASFKSGVNGSVLQTSIFPTIFVSGGYNNASTTYNNPDGHFAAWNATESQMGNAAGGISTWNLLDWIIDLPTAPGAGASWTFCIRVGPPGGLSQQDTAALIQISDLNTTGRWTGSVPFTPGQLITVRCTPAGTPAAPGNVSWSTKRQGNGSFWHSGASGISFLNTGLTKYLSTTFGGTQGQVEEGKPVPTGGTLAYLYAISDRDPGAGQTYTITLYVNPLVAGAYTGWVAKTLSCQIVTGATLIASDTNVAHAFHLNAGDMTLWQLVSSASAATNARIAVTAVFIPDNVGECIMQGEYFPLQNTTRWNYGEANPAASETGAAGVQTVVHGHTMSKYVALCTGAVSTYTGLVSGQTISSRIRKNAADSSPLVTWTATGIGGANPVVVPDPGTSCVFADGDLVDMQFTTSATLGNTTGTHYGFVMLVPQPTVTAAAPSSMGLSGGLSIGIG